MGKSIRSCAHGRYVIFFESDEHDAVLIVRILHGARDLPALFQAGEPGD
ncbi:type II toxin-antitoxin system RelE/ParE family toxin [Vandammella animalimorsus]|nr:type II toxin-antitoxin system RelE/ParE family toxin [Vandammella animalimorsus]